MLAVSESPPRARVELDAEALELLAELVASKIESRATARAGWVGADVVAGHLGVTPDYVYEHADELRAVRLGDGPRGRLRFRLELVDQALAGATASEGGRGSQAADARGNAAIERRWRPASAASAHSLPVRPIWGDPAPGIGARPKEEP